MTSPYAENPRAINIACEAAQKRGEEVSEDVARAIAGQWHYGQASPLYAFASSGHFDRDALLGSISALIQDHYDRSDAEDRLQLDMFATYVTNRES